MCMKDNELKLLHSNQRYVVLEMMRRGIKVELIDLKREIIRATYGNHVEYILDRNSSIMPYSTSVILGDKYLTKTLLKDAGYSVCDGCVFNASQKETAIVYASMLGYPVTLKPVYGSHGDEVYVNIENEAELRELIDRPSLYGPFIVEKYFKGNEYRVFITKNGDCAVLHRDPAHIFGDGKSTIKELVDAENLKREKRLNSLCPILLDDISLRFLKKCGLNLNYIPKEGQKVYLRDTSNVAKGGVCVNMTSKAHSSVIKICQNLLVTFGNLAYAGIDFMTEDISKPQQNGTYSIIEVNTIPGVSMHMKPGIGKAENVPKMMVDLIFPETKEKNDERTI